MFKRTYTIIYLVTIVVCINIDLGKISGFLELRHPMKNFNYQNIVSFFSNLPSKVVFELLLSTTISISLLYRLLSYFISLTSRKLFVSSIKNWGTRKKPNHKRKLELIVEVQFVS